MISSVAKQSRMDETFRKSILRGQASDVEKRSRAQSCAARMAGDNTNLHQNARKLKRSRWLGRSLFDGNDLR